MKTQEKQLRILSNSDKPFSGRQEAGRLLAAELSGYKGRKTAVLGIPRGGMVVAGAIAGALKCDLDIVISRKLRAPMNPEFALGAVTESGKVFLDNRMANPLTPYNPYIAEETAFQIKEIQRRVQLFRSVKPKISLGGRIVIVTDDGLATGSTMQAALWSARQEGPARLIAALPVAAEDSLRKIEDLADETVCLRVPPDFFGVGQFYDDFGQVSDDEVMEILKAGRLKK